MQYRDNNNPSGFTIVELLVVIVVIGILAAITVVSYTGIRQRATVASIQSDLNNISKQIKLYHVSNSTYPFEIDDCPSPAAGNACLTSSPGNDINYGGSSANGYCVNVENDNISYFITNDSTPEVGVCPPIGFILVPGSVTYGTSDFYVMKYEAKQYDATTPISQAAGSPWDNISIGTAVSYSTNVANCTGCHLITDEEWLTIAQNVLSVPSNWSGGAVGSGYIYSGHSDGGPGNTLAADTNDNNGYFGTNNTDGNQRRTLTLTNGEVIWDFVGNVHEPTTNTNINGGQPGIIGDGYHYREWVNMTAHGTLSPDPWPSATGIPGAETWTSANGIGRVWSSADETATRVFIRGGSYNNSVTAGVLGVLMNGTMSGISTGLGFRVAVTK